MQIQSFWWQVLLMQDYCLCYLMVSVWYTDPFKNVCGLESYAAITAFKNIVEILIILDFWLWRTIGNIHQHLFYTLKHMGGSCQMPKSWPLKNRKENKSLQEKEVIYRLFLNRQIRHHNNNNNNDHKQHMYHKRNGSYSDIIVSTEKQSGDIRYNKGTELEQWPKINECVHCCRNKMLIIKSAYYFPSDTAMCKGRQVFQRPSVM